MCGSSALIKFRITRSTLLAVFFGASPEIANRRSSSVLPSLSILATGEVQTAAA
jgi:hypothetical protein